MATEVILDTIRGAELDVRDQIGARQIRGGVVRGIPVEGAADATVLGQALEAIIAVVPWGSPNVTDPKLKSNRIIIRPEGLSSDRVRFEVHYETAGGGGNAGAYILRDGSTVASYSTRFIPGPNRHERIACAFEDPESHRTIQTNSIDMQLLRPVRTITVTGIVLGPPISQTQDYVGMVNDKEFLGKPRAYWILMGWQTTQAKFSGYHQFEATAYTKNNEDWSEIGVLIDPLTGLQVGVSESELHDALAAPYEYGNHPRNGFTRVCAYETTDFDAIFGTGLSNGGPYTGYDNLV